MFFGILSSLLIILALRIERAGKKEYVVVQLYEMFLGGKVAPFAGTMDGRLKWNTSATMKTFFRWSVFVHSVSCVDPISISPIASSSKFITFIVPDPCFGVPGYLYNSEPGVVVNLSSLYCLTNNKYRHQYLHGWCSVAIQKWDITAHQRSLQEPINNLNWIK